MNSRSENTDNRFSIAFLAFAIVTRIITYLWNRSLFLDEASLALNVIEKNWQELTGILDYTQSAPVGFLLVSKWMVTLFGHGEFVLRLFPLILSILSCFILYQIGRSIEPRIVPILMLWFASSSINLRYATEFKPYSGDLMFTLLLTWIAIQILNSRQMRYVIAWLIVSVIAVWFSHATVFVIAGMGITLIFILAYDKQWKLAGIFAVTCILAALSFLVVYLNFYQYTAVGTDLAAEMQTYWANDFFQLNFTWLVRFPFLIFQFIAGFENPVLLIIIIFAFIIGLRRSKPSLIALMLMPVLITLIASYLQLYPLRNRFILFLLPGVMLIIANGLFDVDLSYWQPENLFNGLSEFLLRDCSYGALM